MDLETFSVEELLLAAIKSEMESKAVYETLAGKVGNSFLKDRLKFLAKEEVKHKAYLVGLFKKEFGRKRVVVPKTSPVPLPLVIVEGTEVHVSTVLEQAMGAEKAAHDFYKGLAGRFEDKEVRSKLEYLAKMEMGHFKLLEMEAESLRQFEDYIVEWPLMHLGP